MILENIARHAIMKPDLTAILDKERSVTYKELEHEIKSRAKIINEIGVKVGEPIGLLFPNSVDAVSWMLAMLQTDHPVVLFGSRMKENEVKYHINKIGLNITLADSRIISDWVDLSNYSKPLFGINNSILINYNKDPASNEEYSLRKDRQKKKGISGFEKGDFICHFTSGSEGEPKAVIRTLEAVESEIIDTYATIQLDEEQTFLTIPPICHSFGLIAGTLLPLYYGHRLILMEDFIPEKVLQLISEHKVNVLFAVPYMYYLLNKRLKVTKMDISSIRMCFSAGAPLDISVYEQFWQLTGVKIIQDYGSMETGVMCLNLDTEKPKSVGKPVINRTIKIINEAGEDISTNANETGEICIRSKANLRKYLYPEELNSLKFYTDYFRTGDIGRIGNEGEIYLVGRLSSIMNVAGNKVDPVEVENIIKEIPGVKEAAVVCIDDLYKGSIIKAYVVAEGNLDEITVKKYCKRKIADYKIPKIVMFINELPRSQTGKILKKYLMEEFQE